MSHAASSTSARVLVADDSVVCRTVLVILLENAGYKVFKADDGRQAIDLLKKEAVDLAVLDNDMPNLDGLGTLAELRAFLPGLPVIVCSGTVSADQADRYRQLGVQGLLNKPVDPRALRDKIAHVLARQQSGHGGNADGQKTPTTTGLGHLLDAYPESPLFAGSSRTASKLESEIRRLREFRPVTIIEGEPGSGRFELATLIDGAPENHKRVCRAEEFDLAKVESLLNPLASTEHTIVLIVQDADRLKPDAQALLDRIVRGDHEPFEPLIKRLRVILCASPAISEIEFNESLLMRAATATLTVPKLGKRRDDWPDIADTIVHRCGALRTFTPEARQWITKQPWSGDYMQLHRTLELTLRQDRHLSEIEVAHLEIGLAAEPGCKDPLFHDMLFHIHAGEDT